MSLSEVASLRRKIELECEAMKLAMRGFAVTGSHDVINHKYRAIGTAQEKLAAIVGEKEAARIAVEVYIHVMDGAEQDV